MTRKPNLDLEALKKLSPTIPFIEGSVWSQVMHLSKEQYDFLESNQRRYGDNFIYQAPGEEPPRVVISDPEDIKVIMALKADDIYSADPGIIANLGERSVMFLDGQAHKKSRALIAPPINGKTLDSYAEDILAITQQRIDGWQEGSTINLLEELVEITLAVIGRCIFGLDFDKNAEREQLILIDEWLHSLAKPSLQLIGTMLGRNKMRRFLDAKTLERLGGKNGLLPYPGRFSTKLKAQIVSKLQEDILHCRSQSVQHRQDVLALLSHTKDEDGNLMDVDDIIDQLLLFFSAGHETTAKSTCWVLKDILQRPKLMQELQQEVQAAFPDGSINPRQCTSLPLLNSMIKETMRLTPVTTMVQREVTRPVQFKNFTVPEGTLLTPSNFLAQRHRDYWESPLEFRPERFIDYKPANNIYSPFGMGDRKCLGMSMAYLEMPIIVAAILSRVDFSSHVQAYIPPVFSGITLAPTGGIDAHIIKKR